MVTPLGNSAGETWKNLLAGKSGVGPITRFDTTGFPVTIGAEVKDFDPAEWMDRKDVKKMDTFIHYALAAAKMAVEDARLTIDASNRNMVGVYVGSGIGGLPGIEFYHQALMVGGPRKVSPFLSPW